MIHFKYLAIVLFFTLLINDSFAFLSEIETPRLKSSSGAGVGSILLNEASILNPASIAFHSKSSVLYQEEIIALKGSSEERKKSFQDKNSRKMLTITDTSSTLKGGFNFEQSKINRNKRTRINSSGSALVGKSTSLGVLLKYSEDKYPVSHKTYTQFDIGLTHIFSEKLSFGSVLQNATRTSSEEPVIILGAQYGIVSNLDLLLDIGATYDDKPEENTLQRIALQLKVFESLFLRSGQFYDKIHNTQGRSWGISWIGPRISLEYAYKSIEQGTDDSTSLLFKGEETQENVLSLVMVF